MEFIKDFIRNYSGPQLKQPVGAPMPKPPPMPSPHTRSQNVAPTIPLSRHTARIRSPPVVPNRPIRPVIEDDKFPLPTRAPPPQPVGSIPPQHGNPPLLREMELKQTRAEVQYSRPRYTSVFRSARSLLFFLISVKLYRQFPPDPVFLSHSISYPTSPTIVPSRSASSTSNTGTLIRRKVPHRNKRVDLPASNFEAVSQDKTEFLTPHTNQTAQLPSQISQHFLGNLEGQLGKEVVADNMDFIKDFIRSYSERQQNQPLASNRLRPTQGLPSCTMSQNGVPIPPPSSPAPRTQPPPVAPNTPINAVIEDEQSPPPPPPRRPTPLTHGPPKRLLLPQPSGLLTPSVRGPSKRLLPQPGGQPTPSTHGPPPLPKRVLSQPGGRPTASTHGPPKRLLPQPGGRPTPSTHGPPPLPKRLLPQLGGRSTPSTHGPPPPPQRRFFPGGLPLLRDMEANQTTKGIRRSRPRYSSESVFRSSRSPFFLFAQG